jgi:CRISPR type I-A-associated protein Csa5
VGKEVEVTYVEEETIRKGQIPTRAWLHGRLLQVGGEWKILYTPPRLPSDGELAEFFDEVRKNIGVAKLVASLAMTKPEAEGREEA